MTKEFMNILHDITDKLKILREGLPDVDEDLLAHINTSLTGFDLSQIHQTEVQELTDAIQIFAFEINQTMEKLDQHCNELKGDMEKIYQHSHGLKAYTVAQQS